MKFRVDGWDLGMTERVLAEGPGRIALSGAGNWVTLSILDGEEMAFPVEVQVLLDILDDVPVQLSRSGGHCRLEAERGRVRIEFVLERGGRGFCALEADSFRKIVCELLEAA